MHLIAMNNVLYRSDFKVFNLQKFSNSQFTPLNCLSHISALKDFK